MRPEQAEATYLKDHVLSSVCTEGGHPGNSVLKSVKVRLKSQPVASLSETDSSAPNHETQLD